MKGSKVKVSVGVTKNDAASGWVYELATEVIAGPEEGPSINEESVRVSEAGSIGEFRQFMALYERGVLF